MEGRTVLHIFKDRWTKLISKGLSMPFDMFVGLKRIFTTDIVVLEKFIRVMVEQKMDMPTYLSHILYVDRIIMSAIIKWIPSSLDLMSVLLRPNDKRYNEIVMQQLIEIDGIIPDENVTIACLEETCKSTDRNISKILNIFFHDFNLKPNKQCNSKQIFLILEIYFE